ncbi:MAG: hypothetical protein ABSH52_04880 [Terriglobia bacterium]|jgi:hypothetical protein
MVKYYELGGSKCLNEIVVAGSHDAGITSGKSNVQTQGFNIFIQAGVGVRFFDLRIAAAAAGTPPGGVKRVELKAIHAADKVFGVKNPLVRHEDKTRQLGAQGGVWDLKRTKLIAGAGDFGASLDRMLQEARDFVTSAAGNDEFLILKFDKCQNWEHIAERCNSVLQGALYTGGGNVNTMKLKDLRGKVVVLFSPDGANTAAQAGFDGPKSGILKFKNLYEGGAYEPEFNGLQYYGKGGTSIVKPFKKQSQNVKKQGKLLEKAKALVSPQVMAMMYWTTTGLFESIKKRNDKMWDPPNVQKMKQLWASGLADMVESRNPLTLPQGSPLVGATRKRFMPNIVMIDFADPEKCQTIRGLNDLSPHDLAGLGADV